MGKTESKPKPSADRHLSYIINSGQHGVKPEPVQLAEKRWAVQSTNQHPRLIDTSPILWSKVGSTESKPLPLSDRQLVWKHWAVHSTNQHPWLIHTSPIKLGTAQYKPAPAADRHLSYKTRQCTVQTHIRGWCLPKKTGQHSKQVLSDSIGERCSSSKTWAVQSPWVKLVKNICRTLL